MVTEDLFDLRRARWERDRGRAAAAMARLSALDQARNIARAVAMQRPDRTITIDEVAQRFDMTALGPAAGSVFKTGDWAWTGQYQQSRRISNHARVVRVWRLK